MISFNIFGDCVSRDILTPLVERGGVQVLQYVSFSNPFAAVSPKSKNEIQIGNLEKFASTNFDRRCMCLDFNKTGFDYLFKKKADYLIIDILDSRIPLAKNAEHYITQSAIFVKNRNNLDSLFDVGNYVDVDPFEEISMEQWQQVIEQICDKILYHYSPNQIIINKHFMCEKFYGDNYMATFPDIKMEKIDYSKPHTFYNSIQGVKKTNKLATSLFEMLCNALRGCHVIEFPENIIADGKHKWGWSPLHYSPIYYEYGAEAIKIICNGYSQEKEKNELARLREIYSEKATLQLKTFEKLEFDKQLFWVSNALNFAKELAFDQFGNNKFSNWLEKQAYENKKIAILKVNDIAGQILLRALAKYNVEVIFTSPHGAFEPLTDAEREQCKDADVVVCADVHGTSTIEYNGLSAIRIADLIK